MDNNLSLYNTLSRKKERFEPINPPFAGLYVCGPTVYGDPHLGHARPAITFDLVFRYLQHLGYKVRYVRNITDVGHLEADLDEGEDKIAKKARLEQMEPMEIAQFYADRYFVFMEALNVKRPSIEPRASGHIIEQIRMVQKILDAGFAYEVNGSVYFDIEKYSKTHEYGKLSGRVLDDLMTNSRMLEGQDEKHNPADFALWKKAQPEHIMRWPSPWSDGFPGWHLECSAMSARYLGEFFDIHGGGMDLLFPHHEAEIAQCQAALGHESVKYWLHNNMVTINGQKMGKSLGNFITLEEFFTGSHQALKQAYSPMTIRFFILQAHYRGTIDFSNEALQATEKGLKKLMNGYETLQKLIPSSLPGIQHPASGIRELAASCYNAMNDDFNSPGVIANLFEMVRIINSVNDKKETISAEDLELLRSTMKTFLLDILGLKDENSGDQSEKINGLMELILVIRQKSRETKDWDTSDQIRDTLQKLHISVKDGKEGSTWNIE
ncbi:MAG: cysteine--tRNA ligase [Bacteroidales bacterium]|jgi:cysteinyl-tRNA synthetase|nr:cysteine--tRNA ligase [Bacteroidales bacterium]